MFLWLAMATSLAEEPQGESTKDPTKWEFRELINPVSGQPEPMAIAQSIRQVQDISNRERHGFLSIQCSAEGAVFAVAVPGLIRAKQSRDLERLVKSVKAKIQIANDVWDLRVFPFETLDGWAVTVEESKALVEAMYASPQAVITVKTPMRKGDNVVQFQPESMTELGQLPCMKPDS